MYYSLLSLAAVRIFFSIFAILIVIYLDVDLFRFTLFGTICASYICFLLQVWEIFSHNLLKYIFVSLLFLSFFFGPYNVNVSTCNALSDIFQFSFMLNYLLSAVLIGWHLLYKLPVTLCSILYYSALPFF